MMKRLAKMAVMAIAGSVMFFNGNVIAEEIEAENAAGCVEGPFIFFNGASPVCTLAQYRQHRHHHADYIERHERR